MVEIGDIYSRIDIQFVVQVFKIDLFDGEMLYGKVLDAHPKFTIMNPIGSTFVFQVEDLPLYEKINTTKTRG